MRRAPVLLVLLAAVEIACRLPAAAPGSAGIAVMAPIAPIGAAKSAPIETLAPIAKTDEADAGADAGDDPFADALRPCDPTSGEGKAAAAAVDELGARITALHDAGSPKVATTQLTELLRTQCFRLSSGDPLPDLTFDSGLSLRTWWRDGGEAWLRHYLELDRTRTVVIPPTPRTSLLASGNATHPLAPLLCGAHGPATCGRDVAGWLRRADTALERVGRLASGASAKTEDACAKEAVAATVEDRFGTFRECLEDLAPKRAALPLGTFKAPSDGWLVLRSRSSSRSRCEALDAYDLATGAAVRVTQCGADVTHKVGRVGVAAVREAAWMLAFADAADASVRTSSSSFEVPDDIAIERPANVGRNMSIRCGFTFSTGIQQWAWMRDDGGKLVGQVSGVYRRPGASDAEAHALDLLAIAADGFEEGCAPNGPPARVAWSAPGQAVGRGSPAAFGDSDLEPARGALVRARPNGRCAAKP